MLSSCFSWMMEWLAALENSAFGTWVRQSRSIWAYPSILTAHTIGLGILVGGNVVLDLVVLGLLPGVPLEPLERLFPVMWAGFWINAISGVSLFIADATTKATQTIFYAKMGLIALGVVNMIVMRRTIFGSPDPAARVAALTRGRRLAGASLALWAGAITAGRLMAYVK